MVMPACFILLSIVLYDQITAIFRGYEVKEALRAQMEVQSKLHLQVEVIFPFIDLHFSLFMKSKPH